MVLPASRHASTIVVTGTFSSVARAEPTKADGGNRRGSCTVLRALWPRNHSDGRAEIATCQIRAFQLRPGEIRPVESRPGQRSFPQVGAAEIGVSQVRVLQIRFDEKGIVSLRG